MIDNSKFNTSYTAIKLPIPAKVYIYKKEFLTIFLFLLFSFFTPSLLKAQEQLDNSEEITVFLSVQGIGGFDISAIYKNDEIFLPVNEVFQCLKINQKNSDLNDSISGFYLNETNKYIISKPSNSILLDQKLIQLSDKELIKSDNLGLALRLDQYSKVFGLNCSFSFSNLMVELKTNHELPLIKEMRLEQIRKNIHRLRGDISVDTTIQRKYHLFKGGMADWAVYSTQSSNGSAETRALLGIGTEFLGGETNIELNYSTRAKFEKRTQQYRWRWANNNTRLVKQITLGKIPSRSIASIYSPIIGGIITNTPTTYRRSFGSYTLTDFTEPGWTVELYINNVIVDYTIADASGFYKFDIPLVYGSSNVLIKYYGPWGEERSKEQRINVPFNFLPSGELQYTIAGAMVQDTSHSIFSRSEANYGINRYLTIGAGLEYLSSIKSTPSIPFINASAQLFSNFLINTEYAHGVRSKTILSYSSPSNFTFDIDYTRYAFEQKAITYNYVEERKIRVSIPLSLRTLKAYSRLSFSQNILKETTYSTAEATLSTFYKGLSANFTGNANWLGKNEPFIYGNLAVGYKFFKKLSIRPQIQYDFSNSNLIFTKIELENYFSPKCHLSMVWENNIRNNFNSLELTFRYDLSFAQISANARVSKNFFMTGQSARGSLAFGSGHGQLLTSSRPQVGKTGLTIIPYLDINNDNHRNDNEPITSGLNLRINGGRILPNTKDSIIRVVDLEPFTSYLLEFSDTQFDNIAWQLQHKTISILMDPNQFKLLELPIKIMGEINGVVYMKTGSNLRSQSRIQINIFSDNGRFIAKTQSESDGYFNYIGLAPGSYYAEIDSVQVSRLKVSPSPKRRNFEIRPSENGDIIDNIEFVLIKKDIDSQSSVETQPTIKTEKLSNPANTSVNPLKIIENTKTELPIVSNKDNTTQKNIEKISPAKTDSTVILGNNTKVTVKPKVIENPYEINTHKYFIQAGAFKDQNNAEVLAKKLQAYTSKPWMIISESRFYKVRLGYFETRYKAFETKKSLTFPGIRFFIDKTE